MLKGRHSRRKLSAISFLFVMAICAAFAAHERLHDLELAEEGHSSNHHDVVVHDHPGIAPSGPSVPSLVVVALAASPASSPRTETGLASPGLLRPGPYLDDDVGLHDLLSVYRI